MGIGKYIGPVASLAFGSDIGKYAQQMFGSDPSKKAYKLQRKLLQHQIPDMVAGAEAAGLHPLAALGVNPASSPVSASVGGDSGFSGMGANLMQLVNDGMGRTDTAIGALQLENAQLQNDYLRSQIANSQASLLRDSGKPVFPGGVTDVLHPSGAKSSFPEGYAQKLARTVGDETAEAMMLPGNVVDVLRPGWSGPVADIVAIRGELRNWWNTYQDYISAVTGVKQK